ncbi:hypothetical protein, partial [Haloarchaeobius iranensis]
STEATSCRALVLLDTVSKPCGLPWEAFYDTLLIPLSSSLQSMPRYTVGTLVFLFFLSDLIDKLQQYKWVVLAALASWNMVLLFLWFSGSALVT